jgi:hypothetical protein
MTSRGKSGISSEVAALFTVVIVFVALVPTFLFTQSLYAILSKEVNERRYFEIDRSSEELEVFVMQSNNKLILRLVNTGPISLVVVRVWAYSFGTGSTLSPDGPCDRTIPPLPRPINPGSEALIDVSACVQGHTGYAMFKVVTERGRQFTSGVVILQNGMLPSSPYPFTLTVSIINMQRGRTYMVEVTPLDNGTVSPRFFTHKATASNENVIVAFGVTAGTFRVTLYENLLVTVVVILVVFMRELLKVARMPISAAEFIGFFLPPVIFIAAISGLVAGKISTSRVAGGFVHAMILSAVSLIAIWIAGTVSVQLFKLPSVS